MQALHTPYHCIDTANAIANLTANANLSTMTTTQQGLVSSEILPQSHFAFYL